MENFDDRYKRKNPFSVPEGYFDRLDNRIEQRIEAEKHPQKVRLITLLKPYMGLVAIFLLALFIVQVVLPRVVDKERMLVRDGREMMADQETKAETFEFDTGFNPTKEEILEYLSTEVDDYELLYADLY
ncbi:MAG: hypothetical protein NC410_07345 [Oscillibacter sp.]|nr:hypothetical protein [Oscillibacter sp.]